jgi:periplasmic copper chaperone A
MLPPMLTPRLKRLLPLLLLASLVPAATAGAAESAIKVEKAWARATMGVGATGIVYLTLINSGPEADRLTGVSTPIAADAGMHVMVMEGSVMQMRSVDALDVKPGDSIQFKPGGLHIMLTKLKERLKQGDRFPLALAFQKAGTIDVEVKVLPLGAGSYP